MDRNAPLLNIINRAGANVHTIQGSRFTSNIALPAAMAAFLLFVEAQAPIHPKLTNFNIRRGATTINESSQVG
jgi:hypothetical protein